MIRLAALLAAVALCGLLLPGTATADGPSESEATTPAPSPGAAGPIPPADWVWVKQRVAIAVNPLGLMSDTRIQARTAGLRNDTRVFRNTHFGAGARIAITPAFADVGGHFTLAPIDVFDMDLRVGVMGSWKGSSSVIPYAAITDGTLEKQREARKADWAGGLQLYATAAPTLKVKLGPIIVFDAWTITFKHQLRPDGETREFHYDAFRDLVVAWDDVIVQQQAGVLGEILDGTKTAVSLRLGATVKDVLGVRSKDRSTSVGFMGTFKPGRKQGWPTIATMVLGYLTDNDRALSAPYVAVFAQWDVQGRMTKVGRP